MRNPGNFFGNFFAEVIGPEVIGNFFAEVIGPEVIGNFFAEVIGNFFAEIPF
jgi:hypothetical protein